MTQVYSLSWGKVENIRDRFTGPVPKVESPLTSYVFAGDIEIHFLPATTDAVEYFQKLFVERGYTTPAPTSL